MQEEFAPKATDFVPATLEHSNPGLSLTNEMGSVGLDVFCSWPLDTPADRELVLAAKFGDVKDLDLDLGDNELALVRVMAHRVAANDDKERPSFTRCVLIDRAGVCWASGSTGVADSVKYLIWTFGMGPWEPALRVKLKKTKTGQPAPFQTLQYLGRADADRNAKGAKTDAKK